MSVVDGTNWMSGIDDGTLVSRLSILGSHETCALKGGGASQCQSLSVTEQLNRGVRFLDIRCVYAQSVASDFPIMHGGVMMGINFEQVQQECAGFLRNHPDETIIMNVQHEQNPMLINKDGKEFTARFVELMDTDLWTCPDSVPTLGDNCRGKIILVRPWEIGLRGWPAQSGDKKVPDRGGLGWNGFCHDGGSMNDVFVTQNGWDRYESNGDGSSNDWDRANSAKIEAVKAHFEAAAAAPGKGDDRIYLNFTSRAAGAYVGSAAEAINKKLADHLRGFHGSHLGTVPIDFVGNTGTGDGCLENRILQRNPFKSGTKLDY